MREWKQPWGTDEEASEISCLTDGRPDSDLLGSLYLWDLLWAGWQPEDWTDAKGLPLHRFILGH